MIRRFLLKSLPAVAVPLFIVLLSSCTVDENAALTAAGSPMGEAKKGKKTEVHTGPAPLTWAEKLGCCAAIGRYMLQVGKWPKIAAAALFEAKADKACQA